MKILLVEDNQKLSQMLAGGLSSDGFAVDTVLDGEEAYTRVRSTPAQYDVIVLDRMLPTRDGVSVCRQWRDEGITVPIIILTALDSVEDKIAGLEAGADDYLAKPFSYEELVARIRAILRRPAVMVEDVIEYAGIVLNSTRRQVVKKGEIIELTLKEFMVLEYLMRHPGQVISRDTLFEHAWDYAEISFSNTVDVHIKNLRKKIHDDGTIIQTIRGVGYKIEA